MLKKFHQDMVRLGLRTRRQHDLRRTFISFCLGDGASKDILRWITHAPEGDVIDDYTTLVWKPLCREVAKLQIRLPGRESAPIANVANSHEQVGDRVTGRVTGADSDELLGPQTPGILEALTRTAWRGGRDLKTPTGDEPAQIGAQSRRIYGHLELVARAENAPESVHLQSTCNTVTSADDAVGADLEAALANWLRSRDARGLRKALASILGDL
jgi:hypothetical protein